MKLITRIVLAAMTITALSGTAHAQDDSVGERLVNQFSKLKDYYLNQPMKKRARDQMFMGLGTAIGTAFVAMPMAQQAAAKAGSKLLIRLTAAAHVLGWLVAIDGMLYEWTDGEFSIIQNVFLPRPAHAATLSDYYQSSPVAFEKFLQLTPEQAVPLMANNESLATVVQILADHVEKINAQN